MPAIPRDRSVLWICAGFVLGGIFLLVTDGDDPESRVAGLVAIVFFGGLGPVYWWLTRERRTRPATMPGSDLHVRAVPEAARFVPAGRNVGVVADEPRRGMLVALAGCGVFVISGALLLWGAPVASPRFAAGFVFAGVVSIVIFGTFAVIAIAGMARTRALILLPDGVLSRQAAGTAFVPWSAIDEVRVLTVKVGRSAPGPRVGGPGHPTVGLVLDPDARLTGLLRLLRLVQRGWFGCDVTLAVPAPFSPASLGRVLDELVRQPSLRARLAEARGVALVRDLAIVPDPDDDTTADT